MVTTYAAAPTTIPREAPPVETPVTPTRVPPTPYEPGEQKPERAPVEPDRVHEECCWNGLRLPKI